MHSNWIWHNTISDIKEKDDLFKNVAANWVIRCSQIEWSFGNSNDLLFEKDFRWGVAEITLKYIRKASTQGWYQTGDHFSQDESLDRSDTFVSFSLIFSRCVLQIFFLCIYLRMPSRIITYLTYFNEWKIIFNSN